jgi:hypothetical protein
VNVSFAVQRNDPYGLVLEMDLPIDALSPTGVQHIEFGQADPWIVIDLPFSEHLPFVYPRFHVVNVKKNLPVREVSGLYPFDYLMSKAFLTVFT